MEKYKYRVVENKTACIISDIGFTIFLSSFIIMWICLILSISINRDLVLYGLVIFLLSLPLSGVFIGISTIFSTRDRDTKLFLNEIRQELKQAKTIDSLNIIQEKLEKEAIDKNNMIRISFPLSVKEILKEIEYKLEILKSLDVTTI